MTTTPRTDPLARLITNVALILTVIFVLAGLWPPPAAPAPIQIIATPTLGVAQVATMAPVITTIILLATPTPAPIGPATTAKNSTTGGIESSESGSAVIISDAGIS